MLKQLDRFALTLYSGFTIISLLCLWAGFYLEEVLLIALPFGLLFGYLALTDFKKIFYLLLLMLPLSTEFELGGGFATDLPTEPIMVALMAIFILYAIANRQSINLKFLKHPVILLLLLHYCWMWFTSLHAQDITVSLKFMLAKTWYIIVFVLAATMLLKKEKDFKIFFWLIFIPLLLATLKVFLHQWVVYNFEFEQVNKSMYPFFRNHVNYADMITAFYPFLFVAGYWYKSGWKKWLIIFGKIFFLVAIYFSYTRACYGAIIVIGISYFIINFKLFRLAIIGGFIVGFSIVGFFISNNNFVELAPVYEKTLHHKDFGDHIVATYKMQDLSSMERVYRWVAAFYMVGDKPWVGAGPGNFYPTYKAYTLSDFETYMSDNDEHSTVHNYFFLMMTEQGFIGLILFIVFTIAVFFTAEKNYHKLKTPWKKHIVMAFTLSLITLYLNLLLNDMIEVDKTGSFYFMAVGFIVSLKLNEKLSEKTATQNGNVINK